MRYDLQRWDADGDLRDAPPELTLHIVTPDGYLAAVLDAWQSRYVGECLRRGALLLEGKELPDDRPQYSAPGG